MKMPFKLKIRLKRREKIVLLAGGLLALLIISYKVFQWYDDFRTSGRNKFEVKTVYLKKQFERIAEKDEVSAKLARAKEELNDLEKGLLPGDKPSLAAAELQKLLKDTASSLKVDIKSEKIVNPAETAYYVEVPVEIGFTATTAKLKDMILKIETAPVLLAISALDIRVMNFKNPTEVYVVMTVKGFIRKQNTEKNSLGKGANVT